MNDDTFRPVDWSKCGEFSGKVARCRMSATIMTVPRNLKDLTVG